MKLKRVGVGIIGYGGVGRVHALGYRSIPQHYGLPADVVQVVNVATAHKDTAQAAAREIGCDRWTDSYMELIQDPDVDLVTVATPNDSHEEIVVAAAAAGKHVLCEKPVARTVDEAKHMRDSVERAGVKAQVNFNFRYYPAVQHARKLIDEGLLGRPFSYRACFYRSSYIDPQKPMSWRLRREASGGGALFDLGSHVLDAIYFLLGDFKAVMGVAETMIEERPTAAGAQEKGAVNVDDLTLMLTRMANGPLGSIESSRLATGATNEMSLEIYGDQGALRFNSEDPSWLHVCDVKSPRGGFMKVGVGGRFADQLAPHWTMSPGFAPTFAAGQFALLRAISEDLRPAPNLDDGLHVQAVMEAALRASREGRWIALGEVL
jgi:predicted dehydrogenase